MSFNELRRSIKEWEHQFHAIHDRKPSSKDIKADSTVHGLYVKYHALKKRVEPRTPTKPRAKPEASVQQADLNADGDGDTEDDEQSSITEIFPTPQFKGRVLGLFDMEIQAPLTPQKSSPAAQPATPVQNVHTEAETPLSKKTPDYFRRVNLLASFTKADDDNELLEESPLIKRRASRMKSISELVHEASSLRELRFVGAEEQQQEDVLGQDSANVEVASADYPRTDEVADTQSQNPPSLDTDGHATHEVSSPDVEESSPDSNAQDAVVPESHASEELLVPRTLLNDPNLENTAPLYVTPDPRKRKGPKRQTKKVVMRPVNEADELVGTKATQNYVRLKIHQNNKLFKRRRR